MRKALLRTLAGVVIAGASAVVSTAGAQTAKPAPTTHTTARPAVSEADSARAANSADTTRRGGTHNKLSPGTIVGDVVKGGALPPKKKKP